MRPIFVGASGLRLDRHGAGRIVRRVARRAGIDNKALRAFFDGALMSPVLTAHPTEVRRKSMLTREIEIGEIIAGEGLRLVDAAGADIAVNTGGWRHF